MKYWPNPCQRVFGLLLAILMVLVLPEPRPSLNAAAEAAVGYPVKAWGYNDGGRLGDGTSTDRATAVRVLGVGGTGFLYPVAAIAAGGGAHELAQRTDGSVVAWGNNYYGQLGDGTTTDRSAPVEVVGVGGSGILQQVQAVSLGGDHSLALLDDGTVVAWGANSYGQLGDGTAIDRHVPVPVVGVGGSGVLQDVVAVSAGGFFSLALLNDGTSVAWGYNTCEQLGDGTSTHRHSPVHVVGVGGVGVLSNVAAISARIDDSVALLDGGTVVAWGCNNFGQLGDGTKNGRPVPMPVHGVGGTGYLDNVNSISTGNGRSNIALLDDGTAVGWGENGNGQLGDGTTAGRSTPVWVAGVDGTGSLQNIVAVSGGDAHSLALLNDGTAVAWGDNSYGQLGDGTKADRHTPVFVLNVNGTGAMQHVAAVAIVGVQSFALEDSPPDISALSLADPKSDDNVYTASAAVIVSLSAVDDVGIIAYYVDQDSTAPGLDDPGWTAELPARFSLSGPDGPKAAYAWVKDTEGQISQVASASIMLDRVAPAGSFQINSGAVSTASTSVVVSTSSKDDRSGVDSLRISNEHEAWSGWMSDSDTTAWTFPAVSGPKIIYAQFRDLAGNISDPVSDAIDYDPSVASDDFGLSINAGAEFTHDANVLLSLPAKPGTAEMLLSNDGGFAGAAWEPYSTKKSWRIRSFGNQVITDVVYVKFRSVDGTVSEPRTDDIVFDPNPPAPVEPGIAAVAAGAKLARLNTAAQDDRSGVFAMMLSNDPGFAGAAWEPHRPARAWPYSDEATTTVYIRYRDGAGNVSRAFAVPLARPATPAVPAQIAPVDSLETSTLRPTFAWLAVPGAKAYEVQVAVSASFTPVLASGKTARTSIRLSKPLAAGKTLYWRARVAGGEWSPAWKFRTPRIEAPVLVSPAGDSTTTSLTPVLRWKKVVGASSYQVQVGVDDAFVAGYQSFTAKNAFQQLPLLARKATYAWRVRPKVGANWGPWSDARFFATPALATPALKSPAGGRRVTPPITFDWLDVSGATSYRLQLCTDPACERVTRTIEAPQSRFVLAALKAGTYWWRVQASGPKKSVSGWTRAWKLVR